jgi:hypothetical protein
MEDDNYNFKLFGGKYIMKKTILFTTLLILLSVMAFADANMTSPASSGTVTGTVTLNSTISLPSVNVTYQAMSSSTANSSWATICTNTTANSTECSWDSTGVEDASDYQFRAYLDGNTSTVGTTSTSVLVDNTVPQTPSSLTSGSQTGTSVTLSGTVTGANTTSCTVTWGGSMPVSSSPSVTHSSNSCSLVLTNPNDGTYTYQLTASDGTNSSSASSSTSFSIDNTQGGGGGLVNVRTPLAVTTPSSTTPSIDTDFTASRFSNEMTGKELVKTGIGTAIGAGIGMIGLVLGPGVIITMPVGAVIGGVIGVLL